MRFACDNNTLCGVCRWGAIRGVTMSVQGRSPGDYPKEGLKFLIVDDDEYYANQLKSLVLNSIGQHGDVSVVNSVAAAIHSLNHHHYDVCFLDFGLADQVGLQTECIARLSNLMTAMIFTSKKPSKNAALRGLNFGAKDFLLKSHVAGFDVVKGISYALYWKYREIELEAQIVQNQIEENGQIPLFNEHLRHTLEVAKRGKEKVGLMMIGLIGMDPIMEDYGIEVSSQLLKQVGERVSQKVRASDVVARIGDRQFGAILCKVAKPTIVDTISGTVKSAISSRPYNINGYSLKIDASIGTSTFPDDGLTMDVLMENAQKALVSKISQAHSVNFNRPYNYY